MTTATTIMAKRMATGTPMADDLALLRLTQWLSPAFPLGSFAYSHGLERAVDRGDVGDAAAAEAWIAHLLRHGSGQADATLLHATLAGGDPDALADLARALAASSERAEETRAQGAALARTVNAVAGRADPPRPLPVALGVAARPLGLAPEQVVALYLQAFAGNLVLCATRFVPLGQTEGQGALARLAPVIEEVARGTRGRDPEAIATAAFGADLAAMEHETMDVRIYLT